MNSKLILAIVFASLFVGVAGWMLGPQLAMAQDGIPTSCTVRKETGIDECPDPAEDGTAAECQYDYEGDDYDGGLCGLCCTVSTIYYVMDIVFIVLMAVVVGLVVIGAFMIMTAGGDPDNFGKGRKMIMFAAIGLAVALLARAVPALVKFIIG